ncbi:coiled-coil domain containing 40, partial [Homo sapiens]
YTETSSPEGQISAPNGRPAPLPAEPRERHRVLRPGGVRLAGASDPPRGARCPPQGRRPASVPGPDPAAQHRGGGHGRESGVRGE